MTLPGKIEDVAGGFAIGVFIGFSPWHGFHLVLAAALAALFRKNVAAGLLGAMVFNPLTSLLILTAEFKLGRIMTGSPPIEFPAHVTYDLEVLHALWRLGEEVFYPVLFGSLVLGAAAAVAGYFLVRRFLAAYRRRVYLKRHPDEPNTPDPE